MLKTGTRNISVSLLDHNLGDLGDSTGVLKKDGEAQGYIAVRAQWEQLSQEISREDWQDGIEVVMYVRGMTPNVFEDGFRVLPVGIIET